MSGQSFSVQRLRRSFAGVTALYILGVPLLLLANIVLVRNLSVEEFGKFGFAISAATILSLPVAGGLPMLLTRETAQYVRQKNWAGYRGLLSAAYLWVLGSSGLVGLGVTLWWITAGSPPGPEILTAFLLIPLLGLGAIRNGVLKGLGRPVLAEAPIQIMQPLVMVLGYLALAWFGMASAASLLWWYVTAVFAVFLVATVMLIRAQPKAIAGQGRSYEDFAQWRRALLPFALISAVTVLFTQVAVFVAGIMGQEDVIAYLRVAERGAIIIILPFHVLNAVIGPHLVDVIRSGDRERQRQVARHSSRLMFFLALPMGIVLFFSGAFLLRVLFGNPYDEMSYLPMMIISMTQILSMSFGHAGSFLTMSGRENLSLMSQVAALSVTVLACLALIGPYGAVGAAIAVAAGVVVSTSVNVVLVRRFFGFIPGIY